ncbi:MAG: outer membrane beta-barrel protein [Sphingobacteriales bacterium]|nr:outer membrane beta-barrel protein [Sphingobacteriales bacterium]
MKNFFRISLVIVASTLFLTPARSQDKEIGLIVGITEYLGDLTWAHVTWKETKPGFGALYRYYFNPRLNFKGGVYMGWISGWDGNKDADPPGQAYLRNISFKSHVLDFTAQVEYNILPFISGNKLRNWAPYVFAGISVYNFSPKAELDGTWYKLQPLGTEGQGLPGYEPKYSLTQFSIPYGFGIKYSFKRPRNSRQLNLYLWNIGLYVSQNKTFTDHLDDIGGKYPDFTLLDGGVNGITAQLSDREGTWVGGNYVPNRAPGSLRGNPDANDMYMWFGFTISKTFRKNTCFCF